MIRHEVSGDKRAAAVAVVAKAPGEADQPATKKVKSSQSDHAISKESIDASAAVIDLTFAEEAAPLSDISVQRLTKVKIFESNLADMIAISNNHSVDALQNHPETLMEIDALLADSAEIGVEAAEVPDRHLPLIAKLIDGRSETLTELQKFVQNRLFPDQDKPLLLSVLAIRSAIVRVATRKAFGIKSGKASRNQDTQPQFRWRWEVNNIDYLPDGYVRELVKNKRKLDKKISLVSDAYSQFLKLAQQPQVNEAALEKADDNISRQLASYDKVMCQIEAKRAQEEEKARKLAEKADAQAEKARQKALAKEKKEQARQNAAKEKKELADKREVARQITKGKQAKTMDLSKSRDLMSKWCKRSNVSSESQKQKSPKKIAGLFLPWHTPENVTMAPIFPCPRVTLEAFEAQAFKNHCNVKEQLVKRFSPTKMQWKRSATSRMFSSRQPPMKLFYSYLERRPAFYGTFIRKSSVVNARRPFAQEADVDYEFDSDDEWESDPSDGEDVDRESDSEEEDTFGRSDRVDGLQEDGWLLPQDMDEDARQQLDQLGGALNYRVVGPVFDSTLLDDPSQSNRSAEDLELKEYMMPFKIIVCTELEQPTLTKAIGPKAKKRIFSPCGKASADTPSKKQFKTKQQTIASIFKK